MVARKEVGIDDGEHPAMQGPTGLLWRRIREGSSINEGPFMRIDWEFPFVEGLILEVPKKGSKVVGDVADAGEGVIASDGLVSKLNYGEDPVEVAHVDGEVQASLYKDVKRFGPPSDTCIGISLSGVEKFGEEEGVEEMGGQPEGVPGLAA